jgi:hypothetical protein
MAELALGWINLVVSLLPMEKLCQLMMALALLVTVRVLPLVAKLAVPLMTCGVRGLAPAALAPTRPASTTPARSRRPRRRTELCLPWEEACSWATTQALRW